MEKRVIVGIVIVAVIAVVLLAALYFTFFYAVKCQDKGCFNDAMAGCKKGSFLEDAQDAVWMYTIDGKSQGQCEIEVELVKMKKGEVELLSLENKGMTCLLPLGYVASPQESLLRCHGLLKEEIQGIMITRLHNYILNNLGKISAELEKPV